MNTCAHWDPVSTIMVSNSGPKQNIQKPIKIIAVEGPKFSPADSTGLYWGSNWLLYPTDFQYLGMNWFESLATRYYSHLYPFCCVFAASRSDACVYFFHSKQARNMGCTEMCLYLPLANHRPAVQPATTLNLLCTLICVR